MNTDIYKIVHSFITDSYKNEIIGVSFIEAKNEKTAKEVAEMFAHAFYSGKSKYTFIATEKLSEEQKAFSIPFGKLITKSNYGNWKNPLPKGHFQLSNSIF